MAADAISLLKHLKWKKVDMMGYSMGGVILQEILIQPPSSLPFTIPHAILASTTTKAPHGDPAFFQLLLGLASRPSRSADSNSNSNSNSSRSLTLSSSKGNPTKTSDSRAPLALTDEDRLKILIEQARPLTELGYDKQWLAIPKNRAFVEAKLPKMVFGRPARIIAQQGAAVSSTDHRPTLHLIPSNTQILIIHGKLDRMIAYSESRYLVEGIRGARRVPISPPGSRTGYTSSSSSSFLRRGTLPSELYGHTWYDYFEPGVWVDVLVSFLDDLDIDVPFPASEEEEEGKADEVVRQGEAEGVRRSKL